ncbi:MAG: hypothetical protein EPO26_02380 [Chloroflexota bacterium]|nr:MAG: hypothetical protein EPO26_02380 [Chloroflexota bacterium]
MRTGRIGARIGRRALFAAAAALPLVGARQVRANDHEAWRALIPKVGPPPRLPAPTLGAPWLGRQAYIDLARQTAANLIREDGWVMPSAWYPMLFARDAWWVVASHGDPRIHAAVSRRLAAEQHATGQMPTALYIDGYRPPGRDNDDDSTLLFVMLEYDAFLHGGAPNREALVRAAQWLAARAPGGRYGSQPGGTAYWLDTLSLAGVEPCVAYNQGMYAVVCRALENMGIAATGTSSVEAWYRRLFDGDLGQIRAYVDRDGLFGELRDISALVGEALSWYYFSQPILDPSMVSQTLVNQPRAFYADGAFLGFRNLTKADAEPLPNAWMSDWPASSAGNYQNGGSWLLYDALALYAGARHGVPDAAPLLRARLLSETRRDPALHEYLETTPQRAGQSEERRAGYGWNSFVANLLESLGDAVDA